mmetsp:Transcript_14651/g.16261  ORF Transcript_14651/g.16261 Transcript_14651/m.16261 type:complete len:147 (-) Transcript_14651:14-454(-)
MPPECFCSRKPVYNEKVDIWSLGMLTLRLLTKTSHGFRKYFKKNGIPLTNEGRIDFVKLGQFFDDDTVDFLSKVLDVRPKKRLAAVECLTHCWLSRPTPTFQYKKKSNKKSIVKKLRGEALHRGKRQLNRVLSVSDLIRSNKLRPS